MQDKTQHSEIFIEESRRRHVVRQDRVFLGDADVKLKTETATYSVLDCSAFGIAIISEQDLQGEFVDGSLWIGNFDLGQVHLKLVRSKLQTDNDNFKIAYAVIGEPVHMEILNATLDVRRAIDTARAESNHFRDLPFEFRWNVLNLKHWLENLETEIQKIEKKNFNSRTLDLSEFEETVCTLVSKNLETNLQSYYKSINASFGLVPIPQHKLALDFFRSILGSIFYQSYYAHRAFTKPRGYAGDYEMMNTVYKRENRGDTLFGKCMHRYFIEVPEAQAVRNRAEYLRGKIIQTLELFPKSAKILSVACGPAMELQSLMLDKPHLFTANVEVDLIDQDEEALKETQRQFTLICRQHKIESRVSYHNLAIKNVIEQGFHKKQFNLIYSAGLFDYFSDPVAFYAAKQMLDCLTADGTVIIGNFNTNIPNQFGMVAIMDWNLIYRSDADLIRIFGPLGKVHVEQESLGINLFANLKR